MTETTPTKDEIRQTMRLRRNAINEEKRKTVGEAISSRLTAPPLTLTFSAWRVCLYLSTQHEIPTRYIARKIWEAGRSVCVPAWSRSENAYKLYEFEPGMRLITGPHGIREPSVRIPVMAWDIDAFILPGLAFDTQGGRLGYGAGHYDKILAQARKQALKIAVGHDWQVQDSPLPLEAHDIPVDWIVTDARTINCASNRPTGA